VVGPETAWPGIETRSLRDLRDGTNRTILVVEMADAGRAGFRIDEVLALNEVSSEPIPAPWLAHVFRAGRWIVFATRP
jgi:hypothetical protein